MNCMDIKIESERLLLVPIALKNAEDMFENFTDEITKYMTPKPADDISQTKEFIKSSLSRMKNNSNIQLVILKRNTKEFIGCVGLHNTDCMTSAFGIWIKKSSHRNGYGEEVIHMLYKWACDNIEFDYITYPVDKRNVASRKIPESLGGIVNREFKSMNQSGFELDVVEYHIYPKK